MSRQRFASLLSVAVAMLAFSSLVAAQDPRGGQEEKADAAKALNVIEGVRGGRHWVDQATDPARSPAASLAALQVEPGIRVELVAAEPLVMDPVAIAFDQQGRMFVVEYGDYPIGPEEGGAPLSRVVMLEDTDQDGRMDRRHVFADRLDFAHSLMPFRGGLLVGAKTQILFLKDTNGDHQADERTVIYEGFTPAHPQMQIGNPRWGIDNWIYFNYGPGKVSRGDAGAEQPPIALPRKDLRMHPETFELEADSGMGQFGNTVDRWGNRFYATNRNPIMTTLLTPHEMRRNPFFVISKGYYDVGKSGGDTRVYPLVKMKSNYLSHAGTHTSACGVTAYNGDLLGPDYDHSIFVCEPIGHLVTRSIVSPAGPVLAASRARERADFVASTDTWFRPASLATGPDGALYLADMYRLWVEHPKFLPPEIAAKLDWRAGEDRGRIYRFVPADSAATPSSFSPPESNGDALALLSSANGWRQYLGQRLLVESNDASDDEIAACRQLLRDGKLATTRLHAFWTLQGLGRLKSADLRAASQDADAVVRRDALRLVPDFIDTTAAEQLESLLIKAAADADARVRLQAVLSAGEFSTPGATEAIVAAAYPDALHPWFGTALMTAVKDRSAKVISGLLANVEFRQSGGADSQRLLRDLATVTGARGDLEELKQTLSLVVNDAVDGQWWRSAILSGLGVGLRRQKGALSARSLDALVANPPEALQEQCAAVEIQLNAAKRRALDRSQPLADRLADIKLLGLLPLAETEDAYQRLLELEEPSVIQTAAIDEAAKFGARANSLLLTQWPQLGPAARSATLTFLLRRADSTKLALEAMAAGSMQKSGLSVDQRVRLLKHSNADIKLLAEKLFGGAVSSNRKQVAQKYQRALELEASGERGLALFNKVCSKCHRIDGRGHELGPDLSDVRNRSKLALLYDIMDPNSKVEPRFTAYAVRTVDGEVFNGLVIAETDGSVVLGMGEGKQQTISRGDIEQLKASDVSLMPEGIEKEVDVQGMADLLEYLKTRRVTASAAKVGE